MSGSTRHADGDDPDVGRDPGFSWDLDFEQPVDSERSQDMRNMENISVDYPLYNQRWGVKLVSPPAPEFPHEESFHPGDRHTFPFAAIVQQHERMTSTPIENDRGYKAGPSTHPAMKIGAGLREACISKFDPRFLTLKPKYTPEAERRAQVAAERLKELSLAGWTEDTTSANVAARRPKKDAFGVERYFINHILLPRLHQLTDIVWQSPGSPFIHYSGSRYMKRNPDLEFEDGHGRYWSSDGYDCSPDLVTTDYESGLTSQQVFMAEDPQPRMSWKSVRTPIEVRTDPSNDMRSASEDDEHNQVPRMLKYMSLVVRNHPTTGRAFSITISDTYIRLWTADAASFASSRLYSFKKKEHARPIVDMIAFVTQAQNPQFQSWLPTAAWLTITSEQGDLLQEISQDIPPKLLEVRSWLFGSRTTVWAATPRGKPQKASDRVGAKESEPRQTSFGPWIDAESSSRDESPISQRDNSDRPQSGLTETPSRIDKGKRKASDSDLRAEESRVSRNPQSGSGARKDPTSFDMRPPQSGVERIVLKGSWLYEELKDHEHRILTRLHGNEFPGREHLQAPFAEDLIDPDVLRHLPRSLGLVDEAHFASWTTQEFAVASLSKEPNLSAKARLHFSVLAVTCPLGMRLGSEARSQLSFRQFGQIFLGGIQTLHYSSSKGIHHRDLGPGNWMFRLMRATGKTTPDIVGYLVDFGNARYLDHPRMTFGGERSIAICADDGRSANPLFQSISSMKAEQIRVEYEKLMVAGRPEWDPASDTPETWQEAEDDWVAQIGRLEDRTGNVTHRYLDDVESMLYLICYVVWGLNNPTNESQIVAQLGDLVEKENIWRLSLLPLRRGVNCQPWSRLIKDVVGGLNAARLKLHEASDVLPSMHQIENQCFHDLCKLVERSIPDLPDGSQ